MHRSLARIASAVGGACSATQRVAAAFSTHATHTQTQTRPHDPRESNSTCAVAFDVDGVLLRGPERLPRASEALQALRLHKVSFAFSFVARMFAPHCLRLFIVFLFVALAPLQIPFMLLTNGGGCLEFDKAASISKVIGHHIDPDQVWMDASLFLPSYLSDT